MLNGPEDLSRLRVALAGKRLPAAVVDLDAVDRNIEALLWPVRRSGKTLRVATKSLRCVELLRYIAAHGFPSATPIADRAGRILRQVRGKPCAIVSFLSGLAVRRPNAAHCREAGEGLARLHLAAEGFPLARANDLGQGAWAPMFEPLRAAAEGLKPGLAATISSDLELLARRWPRDLPQGVVHADFFPDNVFFRGDSLSGLIDFYFACNDFFVYDVAICINAWCFEIDGSFNATKARLLLSNYRKVRPLSREELDALPWLCRGSAVRFLLTRLYDWLNHPPGAFVRPKDPLEYLRKLRFHQSVRGLGDYFLDDSDAGGQ